MAEMDTYDDHKVENFRGSIDGEIKFYEQVLHIKYLLRYQSCYGYFVVQLA
jgi:hypothetical protein